MRRPGWHIVGGPGFSPRPWPVLRTGRRNTRCLRAGRWGGRATPSRKQSNNPGSPVHGDLGRMHGQARRRLIVEILGTLFGSMLSYPIKLRNQAADSFFYDVDALTLAEREGLSPLVDMKGTIVVVPPRATGGIIRQYKTAF